jgi:hypothetical protein
MYIEVLVFWPNEAGERRTFSPLFLWTRKIRFDNLMIIWAKENKMNGWIIFYMFIWIVC